MKYRSKLKVLYRSRILRRLARKVRGIAPQLIFHLQGSKLYRILARNLIRTQVSYRAATTDDASAISRFYEYESFVKHGDPAEVCIRELESLEGNGAILIASLRGKLVGGILVKQFPENAFYPDCWVFRMLVNKYCRGLGIGYGLIRKALDEAVSHGAARVSLLVPEDNMTTIKLCRKMGFRQFSIPHLDTKLEKQAQQGGRRIILSIEFSAE